MRNRWYVLCIDCLGAQGAPIGVLGALCCDDGLQVGALSPLLAAVSTGRGVLDDIGCLFHLVGGRLLQVPSVHYPRCGQCDAAMASAGSDGWQEWRDRRRVVAVAAGLSAAGRVAKENAGRVGSSWEMRRLERQQRRAEMMGVEGDADELVECCKVGAHRRDSRGIGRSVAAQRSALCTRGRQQGSDALMPIQ